MMNSDFLIDSNSFIESSQREYAFRCFPGFWKWLEKEIHKSSSKVVVSYCVYQELKKNNDQLSEWIKNVATGYLFDERNYADIWINYGIVMNYIQNSGIYSGTGAVDWARDGKADPLLIAIAMTYGHRIVTFEQSSGQFERINNEDGTFTNFNKNPNYQTSKEPKIPDVAEYFGVECVNLYEVESSLGLRI